MKALRYLHDMKQANYEMEVDAVNTTEAKQRQEKSTEVAQLKVTEEDTLDCKNGLKNKVSLDIEVLSDVLEQLQSADELASKKANVGYKGNYSVEDSFALTLACQVSMARAYLYSYLSEEDRRKLDDYTK